MSGGADQQDCLVGFLVVDDIKLAEVDLFDAAATPPRRPGAVFGRSRPLPAPTKSLLPFLSAPLAGFESPELQNESMARTFQNAQSSTVQLAVSHTAGGGVILISLILFCITVNENVSLIFYQSCKSATARSM